MANVWDVYTVGDVSFVHEVFLGISHIFYGRGENVFLQVYMIGMLLGFIWIFIESMIQQKPIAIGRFFVAFILYSALFVPQATVHLEDSQTKKFYTMDHIPLGLAAGASIVSKIGMGLTRTFEDFFTPIGGAGSGCSPTQMTCTGYLGSLNKIIQIRNNLSSKPAFLAIDRALCNASTDAPALPSDEQLVCNIEKTISNYVRDCSINKFLAKPQLLGTMRGLEDLRYGNASYSTDVYLQPTGKQTLNCHVAFQQIQARLTEKQSEIEKLSLKSEWITMTAHNHTGGGDDTDRMITGAGVNHNQITEILALMTGTSGTTPDAYAYIKNVMFRGPIEEGLIQGFTSAGDLRAAMMIKSAKDQRNIQWAAEENMWISTAKAMATFFEGFVVALAALIPFVMFMGGLNIMVEYLKVLMWVQLWNPVMAICNLYIQTVASQKVKDAIANSPITDLYVIDSVEEVAQHWIAVGGLMAATTPLLALFILKGSVYTFTTLASKMSGGDHVNEKMVSPDVMQHAPLINNTFGAHSSEYGKGTTQVGSDYAYGKVSLGSIFQDQVTSAKAWQKAAEGSFLKSVQDSFGTQDSTEWGKTYTSSWAENINASHAKNLGEFWSEAQNLADQWGVGGDRSMVKSIATQLSLGADFSCVLENKALAGALTTKAGINGGYSKKWDDVLSEKFGAQWSKTRDNVKSLMGNISDQDSLAYASARAHNYANDAASKEATNQSAVASTQRAYRELDQASRSYSTASNMQEQFGMRYEMDSRQLASMIDDGKFEKWVQSKAQPDRDEMGINNATRWGNKTGTDAQKNKTTALEYLLGSGRDSDLAKDFRAQFGSQILSGLPGVGSNALSIGSGAKDNEHLQKDADPEAQRRAAEERERQIAAQKAAREKRANNKLYQDGGNTMDNVDSDIAAKEQKFNDALLGGIQAANASLQKAVKSGVLDLSGQNNRWDSYFDLKPGFDYAKRFLPFFKEITGQNGGSDLSCQALGKFAYMGAEMLMGEYSPKFEDLSSEEKKIIDNQIRKLEKDHPELAGNDDYKRRVQALMAASLHQEYLNDHQLLSNYNHLADEAVGELVNLGVDRETAQNLVDQYNVLTHHDDAVVSYGAAYSDFQKLSEYSKPGEEGKTMFGVNPGEVKDGKLPANPDYVSVDNKHKTPPATPTIRAFYNITHSGSDVAKAQERMLNNK